MAATTETVKVTKKGFDFDAFNEASASETLTVVTLKTKQCIDIEDGDGNPLTVSILGAASKAVTDFERKAAVRISAVMQNQGKKPLTTKDLETIEQVSVDKCVIIVKEWAFTEPCTPDNVRDFVTRNPTFKNQILEALKDSADFLPTK